MTRRVVLGRRLDGSFGLDVSLAGYDAFTQDRMDGNKFSFSSDWADLLRVHKVGRLTSDIPTSGSNTIIGISAAAVFHGLGYFPHAEVFLLNGASVFDDHGVSNGNSGTSAAFSTKIAGYITTDYVCIPRLQNFVPINAGDRAIYVIFKHPATQ